MSVFGRVAYEVGQDYLPEEQRIPFSDADPFEIDFWEEVGVAVAKATLNEMREATEKVLLDPKKASQLELVKNISQRAKRT